MTEAHHPLKKGKISDIFFSDSDEDDTTGATGRAVATSVDNIPSDTDATATGDAADVPSSDDDDDDDSDEIDVPVEPIVVRLPAADLSSSSSVPHDVKTGASRTSSVMPVVAAASTPSYLPPVVPSSSWAPPPTQQSDGGGGSSSGGFTPDEAARLALAATDPGVGFPRSLFTIANGSALHQRRRVLGAAVTLRGCVVCQDAILRGDIARVQLGKYVLVGSGAIVRPPMVAMRHGMEPSPVSIGDYGYIGVDTVVEASAIGSCVVLERDCIVGPRVVISDAVWLLPKSVVPPDATLTTFGVYGGNPATLVGTLHPEAGLFQIRDLIVNVIRATGVL